MAQTYANDLADELLSHYCVYLDKHWTKFHKIATKEERLRFSNIWLRNQSKWYNSDFNKLHRTNNLTYDGQIPEECEDQLLELRCESDREDIQVWLIDIVKEFGEEKSDRLIKLREVYLTLETHEKVLYDLYFTNMNSMREIGSKLNIPLSSVFSMIKDLKNKLQDKCGTKL